MPHWTELLDPDAPTGAYLPWKLVEPRVGISRTTAWRQQKTGDFPRPYVISRGRVGYRESEVEAWKASRGHRSDRTPRPPGVEPSAPTAAAEPISTASAALPVEPAFVLEAPEPAARRASKDRRAGERAPAKPRTTDQLSFDF